MNYSFEQSPLLQTSITAEKMEKWVAAQINGDKIDIDVYGKPTEQQLKDLENVRNLSKELQDNLQELESAVRIADIENQAMNPTAPILDFSEDHEFVAANQLDDYYAEEDKMDAKEEEKRRLTKGKASRTEIQAFYKDQCVFLTGGTGFLGKVLIEKLLRSCSEIDTIYVLVRSKKGKKPIERIRELLDEFIFNRAHDENPKGIHKVVPIIGDMELPGLGISDEDRKTLTSRVTIILNVAATVRFDEKLQVATAINVRGTKAVVQLAKDCRNLRAVTHVSTAFANTHERFIEEKFYDPPISVEALEAISQIDDKVLENITPNLLGSRPNTYCFTKAVAEEVVRKYGEGMPICIVRPAIVISTYDEPVRGWTDSIYGPTGVMVGIGTGVLRTMFMDTSKNADVVPVDYVVNAILASAWHTAKNFKENQTSHIPIYNYVSGTRNPMTWGQFIDINRNNGLDKPTVKAVWYYGLNTTSNYYMFLFYNFFLHYLPALLIDTVLYLSGKQGTFLKIYQRLTKLATILFYFTTQDWKFSDDGVKSMWGSLSERDRTLFPFNIEDVSWDYFAETFILGLRVYLVKDDLSTLPEARKKWNKLYYIHQTLKVVVFGLLAYFAYCVISSVLRVIFG